MKNKGIRIQKRQASDDFIESFRKKLKINLEEPPEILKECSTALILYKEPSAPIPSASELPVEILDKLKREIVGPAIEKLILSKEHFKIEELFQTRNSDEDECKTETEMELD